MSVTDRQQRTRGLGVHMGRTLPTAPSPVTTHYENATKVSIRHGIFGASLGGAGDGTRGWPCQRWLTNLDRLSHGVPVYVVRWKAEVESELQLFREIPSNRTALGLVLFGQPQEVGRRQALGCRVAGSKRRGEARKNCAAKMAHRLAGLVDCEPVAFG
jgi:hypothetical protein